MSLHKRKYEIFIIAWKEKENLLLNIFLTLSCNPHERLLKIKFLQAIFHMQTEIYFWRVEDQQTLEVFSDEFY